MKLKKHRYLAPEPGDTGGTDTGAPPAPVVDASPVADTPAAQVDTPVADVVQATEPDSQTKIAALLDEIGKEPAAVADTPPAGTGATPAVGTPPGADPAKPPAAPAVPPAADLTPPEGLNERANARWTALADRAKQVPVLEQQAAEARQEVEAVRGLVQASGLDPDEFRGALEMGRLFKSRSPQDLQAALQHLDGLRADLSARLGVDAPGIDLLAAHPDLLAKVDGLTLSREDALEIVRLRGVQATHQTTERSQQERQQFQVQVTQAAREMDAILGQRAAMPGHAERVAFIRNHFSDPQRLQAFVTTYQPQQWKAAVLMMYDSHTPAAPAPVPPVTPAPPQPLRPGHVASGRRQAGTQPVSATAAVENAWAAAGF